METDSVKIDEFCLNIPGLSREAATLVGNDVIRIVSKRLPKKFNVRRISNLHVQVNIPQGTSENQLAEIIAEKICRRLD